jgi:plasmid maintenance system antidote protein VapI
VTRVQAAAIVRALLRYGLTVRDIADALGAHPKAIEALIG